MQIFSAVGNGLGQLFGYVLWFFFDLFDNYILAVICFTVVIKLFMFPFELKSRKANAKTMGLNKKRLEIQKRYKNDRQKQSEEIAKLYEQEGVNPAGGCLPQLIPAFSFMGVYFAIVRPLTNMFHIAADKVSQAEAILPSIVGSGVKLNQYYSQLDVIKYFPKAQSLFNMFSESEAHDIHDFHMGFNFFGMDLSPTPAGSSFYEFVWIWPVLCVLTMVLSVFIGQKLNTMPTPEGQGCMKFMPYAMSLPYIFFVFYAPAAIGFYYLIVNILTIGQNFVISKFYNSHILTAREEAARIALRDIEERKVQKRY
ncbi:MAG: Membrane protein insertase YidC [Eubacteriales bacterium SKADARSKE-1]|nr:Membrane protein insertase YidC [Eubacteriales bacterium SKADARSKE-1]